jgi:predicted metalloprotease
VKWRRGTGRSGEVIDRRGAGGMRGMPIPIGVGGGLGGIGLLIFLAVVLLSGGLPGGGEGAPLDPLNPIEQPAPGSASGPDPDANLKEFVVFLVTDVQNQWEVLFQQSGEQYRRTQLVLFTGNDVSGCGPASSATGPFYCPRDMRVYIDLDFFRELRSRFEAAGDFAQAYVIAHEFGHHVQNLLGINDKVQSREDSIKLELQADCLAGVYGYTAEQRKLLVEGDLAEALNAASQIGDDRIQERTQGRVDPESWTHGSSEQRQHWFRVGFDRGDPAACDTGI